MAHINIDFHAADEGGREVLRAIARFPEWSVERAEAEAYLFLTLMRAAYREADLRRRSERALKRKQEREQT